MGKFNRFGNMSPPEEVMRRSYLMAEEPFQIYGNLYFVGNTWCASHLIDTGDGLILLDAPCLNELAYLINNVYKLGFELSQIKYIVVSHAHHDHYGSVRALVHLTGAKTFLGEIDAQDMEDHPERFAAMHASKPNRSLDECFVPDVRLKDGDVITLGNTKMRCVLTPGHTVGVMSHFWDAYQDGESKKVGIYGGAGFVTLREKQIRENNMPANIREVFLQSIDKVWDEPVDIMLGNHPFHNDTFEKHERAMKETGNPFIDPTEWKRYLQELKDCYHQFLNLTEEQVEKMYEKSDFLTYRDIVTPYLLGEKVI
ncbi:MAG: MBL fold metallo-hydrolase [Lachnospiraceae bacterium]|nr:MBL fold metallo-hydrolase [Lachnospiraceae bacterium]